MPHSNFVVAVSGAIGSGKAAFAAVFAKHTGATVVSFGDEVRRATTEQGLDPADRSTLQRIGEALVLSDLDGFVSRTVYQAANPDMSLVVAGVRHWEVLDTLRRLFKQRDRRVTLVHINASMATREKALMADGTPRRLIARYDNDICEAQVARVLPQYADKQIDGDLPVALQVKFLLNHMDLSHAAP